MNTKSILTLRRRLTCLYAVTTSLILTLVLAASLLSRVRDVRQSRLDDFYDLWDSLQFRLQSDHSVSQSYLAQTEAAHSSIIHIEENGSPLLYAGSWSPQTERQKLIRQAISLAEDENVFTTARPVSASSISSSLLSFQGDAGENYYGRVLVLPYGKSVRALCLISYLPPITSALRETFLQMFLLELLGIFCLIIISWNFVGWSLKPVAESQRRQAEFIAAASHELRSPLAVLRSGVAALRALPAQNSGHIAEADSSDHSSAILSALDGECVRMSRLMDDMLLLASADAKTWRLNRTRTDVDTLLIDTYEAYLPLCRQKGVSLRLDLPDQPLPSLLADGERVRQILAILLDNAMTYTPSGKEITIQAETAARKSKELILRVLDQGPGIPDSDKPRIFDRFYRADSARSDKSHYGLGLSIARELTLLHGGSIEVSDAKTGGSCFTVRLPVDEIKKV